jgi:release factor glutamine methyltransferase
MAEQDSWTTLKVLTWTSNYLASKGVTNARLEAEWLLCAATGFDRVGLYLNYDKPLNEQELLAYRTMTSRRGRREPLQHILGTQEFCGLDFEVSADVLIPRYDTEVLVTEAVAKHPEAESILDIGTGSGCIAIALKHKLPLASITAVDISAAALSVAERNAARNNASIEFLCGNLFEPVTARTFDLIVSNPPYIPTADIAALEPEVSSYDPKGALDGGSDGLDLYRRIIPEALNHLNAHGWLLVEIGITQDADVVRMFHQCGGYGEPFTANDPGGVVRVVCAQRREA